MATRGEEYLQRAVELGVEAVERTGPVVSPAHLDALRANLRERLAQVVTALELEHAADLDEVRGLLAAAHQANAEAAADAERDAARLTLARQDAIDAQAERDDAREELAAARDRIAILEGAERIAVSIDEARQNASAAATRAAVRSGIYRRAVAALADALVEEMRR
jgi:hypothetical protein